ncbi:MAG: cobalamin B12-binding domain-containing protein [Gemmatimonadetes bacterium]|nr:cobalamin B12-binding domain-containing protein [Gemmatimonadota bacterium]
MLAGLLTDFSAGPAERPHLLVATPSRQPHELGALMVAVTAAVLGWRLTYLGADLPVDDIVHAARATGAQAVGRSLVHPADDMVLARELVDLERALPPTCHLFLGGAAAAGYVSVLNPRRVEALPDLASLRLRLQELKARGRISGRSRGKREAGSGKREEARGKRDVEPAGIQPGRHVTAAPDDDLRLHAPAAARPRAGGEFVLYWMQTTMRAHDNFALNYAIARADELGLPVLVYHGLRHDYPGPATASTPGSSSWWPASTPTSRRRGSSTRSGWTGRGGSTRSGRRGAEPREAGSGKREAELPAPPPVPDSRVPIPRRLWWPWRVAPPWWLPTTSPPSSCRGSSGGSGRRWRRR